MINDRPDSEYMVVAPTNIRIYCFLVDLPVGINKRPYIEDVFLQNGKDNLCLFRCIVKQLKPVESQEDRERTVKLMWLIFQASKYAEAKSDSVILDHRQVMLDNDIDYLYNEVFDYQDLLRELDPEHKFGGEEVQSTLKNMTGVNLEEFKEVEDLFSAHIDVFGLKEIEKNKRGKNKKTSATVVRLSDRPSDREVNILLDIGEEGVGHYYLVKDIKELLKKLVCEHCNSIIKRLTDYKIM